MMKTDQGLEAVRKARIDISREFGNDPARLVAHYAEMQRQLEGESIIHGPDSEGDDDRRASAAADLGGSNVRSP